MRLILIRHGESEANLRQAFAGDSCTGLSELGFSQARVLAERLRSSGEFSDCQTLLCSPIKRARQTADLLLKVLPPDSVEEWHDLCELHPGEADGLVWTDYDTRFGSFDMMALPDRPIAPGGESWSQFRERVRNCLTGFAERFDGQTVVAVSHGGFITASILSLFDIPRPGTGARLHAAPTSITEWQCMSEAWNLVRYNDSVHLSTVCG